MKSVKFILPSTIAAGIIILLLVAMPISSALAYTVGPYNPGTSANVTDTGTEAWQNTDNIKALDSTSASVQLYQGHKYSNYLEGSNYGFDIPSDAAITGIVVNINRQSASPNPDILDNVVSLVKAGAVVGDNKAYTTTWPTSLTIATYGSSTDLWGTTWTPAEVNSADFGVALAAYRSNNGNNVRTAAVDSIQVTVYYAYATTTAVSCSGTPLVYGDSVTCMVTVTGSTTSQTPSGSIDWTSVLTGTFNPDPCTLAGSDGVATCTTTFTPTIAMSGTVTGMFNGDDYFLPSDGSQAITVDKRPIEVIAVPQTKVYGDPDPALTYTYSPDLVFSDTFTGTLARDPGEDVGNYIIHQGTLALSNNYVVTYEPKWFTITPKPITVTADAQTKVYGEPDPAFTYTFTPTLAFSDTFSDTFTGTLTRDPGEDVGTYTITQGTFGLTNNYNLAYVPNDLTITPKEITVTADAQTKVYGESDPVFTYTYTPTLVFSDTFTGALGRELGDNVGAYTITMGTLTAGDNYHLTLVPNVLTITVRPITVTADAQTKQFGDPDPALTYQITSGSLVFSDTFTGTLTRAAGEDMGVYTITQGTLGLTSNYNLTYVSNDLTITKRFVTVTANAKSKVFGQPDPALTYTLTSGSLLTGDAPTGTLTRQPGEDIGTYPILVGTLSLPAYYDMTYVGANLTITGIYYWLPVIHK